MPLSSDHACTHAAGAGCASASPRPHALPQVLYGSMTGNSEEIARRVHAGALERGIKASLKECNQYKKACLAPPRLPHPA